MNSFVQEKTIHRVFRVSVWLKALNALLEIVGGTLLLFTDKLANIISILTQRELIEDPHDFFATIIQHSLPYLTEYAYVFAALYLLSHGLVKAILSFGLLRAKLWAYPTAIIFFVLFIIYQCYRYTYTHSAFLIVLTVFDLAVVFLTWHEYQVLKKLRESGVPSIHKNNDTL
jgi:uncharacterized membrane protein